MPVKKINWDKQDIVKCDERGRATLGSEFAGEQVFVWIAETPDFDSDYVQPREEVREVLGKMAQWAVDEGIDWYDLHPETGVVEDKEDEEHQSPHSVNGSVQV